MKICYLIVDVQNDFVSGSLGFDGAQGVVDRISSYLKGKDGDFVFTKDTHYSNYLDTQEGKNLPVEHCISGTHGWEIVDELKPLLVQSVVFEKVSFGSPDLIDFFRETKYDRVEIMGLVSNICVISSCVLVKSGDPEVQIVVDKALTDSFDPDLNNKVFDVLKGLQVEVIDSL